ncbi:MAG: FecR domain-containing protein [Dehalococcoidia bacterium]
MKRIVFLVIATLLVIGSVLPGCAPSTLTILSITEGNVSVMKAGTASWIEAEVGMSLGVGDSIKTGDDSSAEITFFDGSTIELQAGTEIEIASLDISADTGSTTITLEQTIGNTISRVTKLLDPASRYEVETPTGVVAVRGSVMQVYVIEDGTTWIINLEGDIWAVGEGVELQIPEGRQCISRPGQPPELIDVYFQTDAYLGLNGPATLPPEERDPCVILGIMTSIVVDSVRVDLPDGGSVIVPAVTDVFSPEVDWTTLFRFSTCEPGMPIAGGEYIFTGLDVTGEPIPGAINTDIWVGVEPPDPPTNLRAEVIEDGILVSWDESPIIPDSFEPAAEPQLGFYQLGISRIETGELVYGANQISASPHLIPQNKADFVEGADHGLSLSEMEDGTYYLGACVLSMAPAGSLGKALEYNSTDVDQGIIFTIQNEEITIG